MVSIAKHFGSYQNDGILEAMNNVLDYDMGSRASEAVLQFFAFSEGAAFHACHLDIVGAPKTWHSIEPARFHGCASANTSTSRHSRVLFHVCCPITLDSFKRFRPRVVISESTQQSWVATGKHDDVSR